ncbi:hypothetical protein FHW58_001646 [Duganella sp. 1224]|uniref:DUF2946 family protein n=1 Tax=Duganella sp. 1224 TaxID=2587052 RepID=UPI0015CB7304|nr:DUF2946 family protein [Duganella sp. 1224]NYE60494.1 hypothetical protein [Duganella sp. 1224]
MLTFLQHRRLTSLIVSLAILLNLSAPAISHAMTALSANPLALDICSATTKPAPAGLPSHAFKHCMLCAVHSGGEAPPPAATGLLAVLEGHDLYPAASPAAAPQAPRWPRAQPRAPPAAA